MRWRKGRRKVGGGGREKGTEKGMEGGRQGRRDGWREGNIDLGSEGMRHDAMEGWSQGKKEGERERWKMGGRASLGIILGEIIPCNCSPSTFGSCALIFEMSSFLPRTLTLHDSPLVPRVPSSFPVSHRDVPSPLPLIPSSLPSPLIPFSIGKRFEAR